MRCRLLAAVTAGGGRECIASAVRRGPRRIQRRLAAPRDDTALPSLTRSSRPVAGAAAPCPRLGLRGKLRRRSRRYPRRHYPRLGYPRQPRPAALEGVAPPRQRQPPAAAPGPTTARRSRFSRTSRAPARAAPRSARRRAILARARRRRGQGFAYGPEKLCRCGTGAAADGAVTGWI